VRKSRHFDQKDLAMALSTRSLSVGAKSFIKRIISPKVPSRLARKFAAISARGTADLTDSLRRHYYTRPVWGEVEVDADTLLATEEGRIDFQDHLHGRLDLFRNTVIPWLDDAKALAGANILEIGCGTGSSTVALAEQGANVVAVDIDDASIKVARDRCRAYGVECEIFQANGNQVKQAFLGRHFDFIIFFACLEHMTHDERMVAMRDTWNMLSKGDLWCTIETPNRLWYFDHHTSRMPFFSWLPDELAFKYSRFSAREIFRDSYREFSDAAMLGFLRQGRGVSYHEFEITMKRAEDLDIVSSLPIRLRKQSLFRIWELAWRLTLEHRFESCLIRANPGVNRGFYQPFLDLIIRKD
jgi:2-polyprenyl-3-methyl-5-hydroxy-6-metoxy-1,4-benzoquinol methylase